MVKIDNLRVLREFMVDYVITQNLPFNMGDYIGADFRELEKLYNFINGNWNCGASACLLGWAVHAFGCANDLFRLREQHYNKYFRELSREKFGIPVHTEKWRFLFSGEGWDNCPNNAVKRLEYVISFGDAPPREHWDAFKSIQVM